MPLCGVLCRVAKEQKIHTPATLLEREKTGKLKMQKLNETRGAAHTLPWYRSERKEIARASNKRRHKKRKTKMQEALIWEREREREMTKSLLQYQQLCQWKDHVGRHSNIYVSDTRTGCGCKHFFKVCSSDRIWNLKQFHAFGFGQFCGYKIQTERQRKNKYISSYKGEVWSWRISSYAVGEHRRFGITFCCRIGAQKYMQLIKLRALTS